MFGSVPTYKGAELTRERYTFAGWTPEVGAISSDTVYTALFNPVFETYDDGEKIGGGEYYLGDAAIPMTELNGKALHLEFKIVEDGSFSFAILANDWANITGTLTITKSGDNVTAVIDSNGVLYYNAYIVALSDGWYALELNAKDFAGDGAVIDGVRIKNVMMRNVNAPLFIHIGRRMRGPEGREIGKIKNVLLEDITAEGPYEPYEVIAWNYFAYKANDFYQKPWVFGIAESFDDTDENNTAESDWQMTSNICGLKESPLENIVLRNVHLKLDGGVKEYKKEVPEEAQDYPEVYVYGRILPAKGIYFRHINGLTLDNVTVETYREDKRKDFVFEDVKHIKSDNKTVI